MTDQTIGFSSVNPLRRVTLDGTATIPFSKSTIEMIGRVTLLGVGDGGTIALFNSTGDLANSLFHLPQVSGVSVGLTDELTVTNAASADGELLFRANGEAGVDVFLLDNALDEVVPDESVTPEHLGALIFGTEESANSLYYRNRFLFVSGGLGGMKIVSLD